MWTFNPRKASKILCKASESRKLRHSFICVKESHQVQTVEIDFFLLHTKFFLQEERKLHYILSKKIVQNQMTSLNGQKPSFSFAIDLPPSSFLCKERKEEDGKDLRATLTPM